MPDDIPRPAPAVDAPSAEPTDPASSHRSTRARVIRVVRAVLLAIAAAWALYLLVANIALNTSAVRDRMMATPQTSQVTFGRMWSAYPGSIKVSDLHVRGQDTRVQYRVDADRASVSVNVFALLGRHVRCSLEADGAVIRIRSQHDPSKPPPKGVESFPPIEADPPLDPAAAQIPVFIDESKAGWKISITQLEIARLRELWFDRIRASGDAWFTGEAVIVPNRSIVYGPLTLRLNGVQVHEGKAIVSPHADATLTSTMEPYDPRTPGSEVLPKLVARAVIKGELAELAFLNATASGPTSPQFAGGKGTLDLDVGLDRGRLVAPSHLRAQLEDVHVIVAAQEIAAGLNLAVDVADEPAGRRVAGTAELRGASWKGAADPAPIVRAATVSAKASSKDVDLKSAPFAHLAWDVSIPEASAPDLRALNAVIESSDAVVRGGEATLVAKASGTTGTDRLEGDVRVTARNVSVAAGGRTVRASASVHVPFAQEDAQKGIDLAKSFVELKDVSVEGSGPAVRGWWGRVDAPDAHVRTGDVTSAQASLRARFRDLDVAFASASQLDGFPRWALGLLSLGPWDASARVATQGSAMSVRNLDAKAEGARGLATVVRRGEHQVVLGYFGVGALSLGIEKRNDSVTLHVIEPLAWYTSAATRER